MTKTKAAWLDAEEAVATLGVSQVGTDQAHVDSCLREVVKFIDGLELAELGEERVEFLHY